MLTTVSVSIEKPHPPSSNNTGQVTSEWSAVGHATATGKSGRVIHGLQEDIALLTRENSVIRARTEETQRMNDVLKTQVQTMIDQIHNLETANERNLQSIARKDDKIQSLKTEVQNEKDRRQRVEGEAAEINQSMGEARDEFNRKTAELSEMANLANTQYNALAHSAQRERSETRRKLQIIREDIASLKGVGERKDVPVERLDAVMAQKNREIETSKESFDKLFEDYTTYKQVHDDEVSGLIARGHANEAKWNVAFASLKETQDKMKWTIAQDRRQRPDR